MSCVVYFHQRKVNEIYLTIIFLKNMEYEHIL